RDVRERVRRELLAIERGPVEGAVLDDARAEALAGDAVEPVDRRDRGARLIEGAHFSPSSVAVALSSFPRAYAVLSATRWMRSVARSAILPSIIVAPRPLRSASRNAFAAVTARSMTAGSSEKTSMAISVCAGMPVHLPRKPKLFAMSASRRHSSSAACF